MQYHNYTDIGIARMFPSLPIVKLLLYCGAPINVTDCHHNTPLHVLAANEYKYYTHEELDDVERIFKLLVDAGAHLDAVTQRGTPEDCVDYEKLKSLFRIHPIQLSLKCICARKTKRRELNYTDCIPKHLQSFIQLH
jgi:hypothetical protein